MNYNKEEILSPNRVALIVLNYNDAETTTKMVDEICKWKSNLLDFRVIVVDNRSSDGSFERLKQHFGIAECVDVIISERNGGYSYGNNFGARFAIDNYHPEFIAIANPDIVVDESTMIQLLQTFRKNDQIAMCAPVMKSLDGSYRVYSQTLPSWKDDLKACRLRNKSATLHMEGYETLDIEGNMILTEMLPGSFFVIRTSCFEEIGMLDENVFLYCEERILGRKLKDAGYKAILRKDLFFVHAHAVSTSKAFSVLKREKLMLNSCYYYQKEYGHCNKGQLLLLEAAMGLYQQELTALYHIRN